MVPSPSMRLPFHVAEALRVAMSDLPESVFSRELGSMWGIHVLLLLAAGLVLADASVVTLALPPVIAELDASVEQAAAVLGVYTLRARGRAAARRRGCRRARSRPAARSCSASRRPAAGSPTRSTALLVLRGVQALGGAALLVGAFTLLDAGGARRRAWTAVGDLRLRRRPGARRRADAGLRLAGDLPRPGPDRAGRGGRRVCGARADDAAPSRPPSMPGFVRPARGARAPLRGARRRAVPARAAARHRLVGRAARRRRGGHGAPRSPRCSPPGSAARRGCGRPRARC